MKVLGKYVVLMENRVKTPVEERMWFDLVEKGITSGSH